MGRRLLDRLPELLLVIVLSGGLALGLTLLQQVLTT